MIKKSGWDLQFFFLPIIFVFHIEKEQYFNIATDIIVEILNFLLSLIKNFQTENMD